MEALPQLLPAQMLKLKQLSVLTLAEVNKVYIPMFIEVSILCFWHYFFEKLGLVCELIYTNKMKLVKSKMEDS